MQEFRIDREGIGSTDYLVLKCPACGRIQRFMHRQQCFGKVPKNAGCRQCQKSFAIDENSLDHDPLPVEPQEKVYAMNGGRWVEQPAQKKDVKTGFTTADRL